MSAPLHFEKQGLRLTVCAQDRGLYVAIGLPGGTVSVILDHSEEAEVRDLLNATNQDRRAPPERKFDNDRSGGADQRRIGS